MTDTYFDFAELYFATEYTDGDTALDLYAKNETYKLTDHKTSSLITQFSCVGIDASDETKFMGMKVSNVVTNGTFQGKTRYTVTLATSTGSNPMVGLANSYDGTTADANIIAGNKLASLPADSLVLVTLGSGALRRVLGDLVNATTQETVTAGEAIDSTSGNLFVSLHTDGKYYKYHKTNYPNLQGVILAGQTIAADGTFTLYNLKAVSTGWSGLTNGDLMFADNGGTATATESATTTYAGIARGTTEIFHAERAPAVSMASESESRAGTNNTKAMTPLNVQQAIQSTDAVFATASGTDSYTATLTPTLDAYVTGMRLIIKFTNANTGVSTLNIDTLGAKTLQLNGSALVAGDIGAGSIKEFVYDGTNFEMVSIGSNTAETADVPVPAEEHYGSGLTGMASTVISTREIGSNGLYLCIATGHVNSTSGNATSATVHLRKNTVSQRSRVVTRSAFGDSDFTLVYIASLTAGDDIDIYVSAVASNNAVNAQLSILKLS